MRFHDLRHTCATLLIAAGAHAKLVQERQALQHHHDAQPVRARVPSTETALVDAVDAIYEQCEEDDDAAAAQGR